MHISSEQFDVLSELAERLRVMGHPIRLMIISQLKKGDRAVSEIVEALDLPFASVSQHLKVMERAGLLASRRQGRQVRYVIHANMVASVCAVLCQEIDSEMEESNARKEVFRKLKQQLAG